jgi:hypothetical protein
MIHAPCKDCKDREYPVCYSRCEAYQTYKRLLKEAQENKDLERMVDNFIYRKGPRYKPRKDRYK